MLRAIDSVSENSQFKSLRECDDSLEKQTYESEDCPDIEVIEERKDE